MEKKMDTHELETLVRNLRAVISVWQPELVADALSILLDEVTDVVETEDCPLDGDAGSALASIGWGTDEDYGDWGDPDIYEPYD